MIELRDVTLQAGAFQLSKLNFTVDAGRYAVLMGRSGMGKTTILEAVCGLKRVGGGAILIGGREVHKLTPGERNIGYVPQNLGLFHAMNVRQHLEFALLLRKTSRPEINTRVSELAEILGLGPLLNRGIQHLSGGEAQRVALGRALSFRPQVLLLDEPLSALDEATRHSIQELLLELKRTAGTTTLHVTHNREEANILADLHLALEAGQVHALA